LVNFSDIIIKVLSKMIMNQKMPEQENHIEDLARKYSLELLLLFGSQVTGETHKESDYDIAYLSSDSLDLDNEGRLINNLMSIVGAEDERKVNLINIKKANPFLLYAITKKCRVLYEREPTTFAALRALAFKKYVEMKPIYEERTQRTRRKIYQK